MSSDLTVNPTTASKRKVDDSFDIEDMVFPLLKPIVTGRPDPRTKMSCSHEQQKNDSLQEMVEVTVENEILAMEDQDGCKTPNSKENKIPIVVNCPLAPRKPRVKPRRSTSSLPQGFFFFPPDLDSAFIVCRVSPPREKLHWPKRISGLKFEQNGGRHI